LKKYVKITALAVVFLIVGTFVAVNYVNVSQTDAQIIRAGSNAGDIKAVQAKLKQWGYYGGKIDGVYGSKTVAAVKEFQRKYSLKTDGIAGPVTLGKMGITVGLSVSSTVVKSGANSADVKKVQQRLKDYGYYKGAIDGVYGPVTAQSVRNYQKDHGLAADGIAGRNTLSSMGIAAGKDLSSKAGSNPPGNADSYLLARCIYAEARGEPYEGQVAIGAVILNRVRHPDFPNTISGVIYQPRAFTVVSDGQINLSPDSTAQRAAQDALNGWDPTNGALFYYNPATATSQWIFSKKVVLRIGRHVFCV
jgi:spore cortex-lytic enzyme